VEDTLIAAAHCLGVPTHLSAGPGNGPAGRQIWACWPRNRLEIAHDALERVMRYDQEAGVTPATGNLWRAYADGGWTYEGDFLDAVASLVLHVAETRKLSDAVANSQRASTL
jgi:hypothetical protein